MESMPTTLPSFGQGTATSSIHEGNREAVVDLGNLSPVSSVCAPLVLTIEAFSFRTRNKEAAGVCNLTFAIIFTVDTCISVCSLQRDEVFQICRFRFINDHSLRTSTSGSGKRTREECPRSLRPQTRISLSP